MLLGVMNKKTHPFPTTGRRAAGAVAFSAAWLLCMSAIAAAQSVGPEGGPPRFPPPAPELPVLELPAPREEIPHSEMTREERLDKLFADLAEAPEGAEGRIVESIGLLWARSGSASMDLLLRRGRAAIEAGDLVRAVHHLTALTDHAPGFAEGWNSRATAFYMMDEWGLALADIERVLALEPRHFGALTGLAVILEKLGRPGDALAAWRRTFALNPHLDSASKAVERLGPKVDGRDI
jgi:tetratricopeptide (TPR) repeat protein